MEQLYTQIQSRLGRGEIARAEQEWFTRCLEQVAVLDDFTSTWQPLFNSYPYSWRRPLFICSSLSELERLIQWFPDMYFELRLIYESAYWRLFDSPLFSRVSHLSLTHVGFDREDMETIHTSPHAPSLCGLSLKDIVLSEDVLGSLLSYPCFEALQELSLINNDLSSVGLQIITQAWPALRWLNLKDNHVGDDGVKILIQAPQYSSLEFLDLNSNGITNTGAMLLANTPKTRPLTLQVRYGYIEWGGWRAMASSKWLSNDTQKQCKSMLIYLASMGLSVEVFGD